MKQDNMSVTIEELRVQAQVFYKERILVFVKRFNKSAQVEYINGLITEPPSADFFFIQDIEEPLSPPKLVFFFELTKSGTIFTQSKRAIAAKEVRENGRA